MGETILPLFFFPEELQTDISNIFHVCEDPLDNLAMKRLPEDGRVVGREQKV
jgi:hypothetical protein